jgi:hypothetical protein
MAALPCRDRLLLRHKIIGATPIHNRIPVIRVDHRGVGATRRNQRRFLKQVPDRGGDQSPQHRRNRQPAHDPARGVEERARFANPKAGDMTERRPRRPLTTSSEV